MSKRTTTRWYIGAWVVWAVCLVIFFATGRTTTNGSSFSTIGTSPLSGGAWLLAAICGIVMLVMLIGALIRLGQQHAWGWFAALLVFQLIALGIVGMVAYAIAGPSDEVAVTAGRPAAT